MLEIFDVDQISCTGTFLPGLTHSSQKEVPMKRFLTNGSLIAFVGMSFAGGAAMNTSNPATILPP
jgi:hypothetical protein